jgi:hypothetical protein
MSKIPRVTKVEALGGRELLVRFENGVSKIYDCGQVLARPQFQLLRHAAFFRAVKVDPGGYGISWSDDIDLSEYELWVNGRPAGGEPVMR